MSSERKPARTSLRASARRSDIASFIVMDVMREAAALEAQGRSIVHMEVGQPGTPAPEAARQAARAALDTETLGYTTALGGSRKATASATTSTSTPAASSSAPARRPRSSSPSSRCSIPARRSPCRHPDTRATATSCPRSAAALH
jgi:hypothetical protein